MKTEKWLNNKIRFVKHNGEWWAVAKDIAIALGYDHIPTMLRKVKEVDKVVYPIHTLGGLQNMVIISEKGLYKVIMRSNKPEAEQFEDWVYETLRAIRQSVGLEGFEVFRMLDKEHQKQAMQRLKAGLSEPTRKDFIKANTIANKAVSNRYGHPKMLKKDQMTAEMLQERTAILEDTVNLITTDKSFKLGLSVSKQVYDKYCSRKITA